jgi:putative ABC transport system permease protein
MSRFDSIAYAFRSLRRRPTFAGLNLILLTLAAGAVTAIFAIVNATLLRPLPFREPENLMSVLTTEPVTRDSLTEIVASPLQLARWRSQTRAFTTIEGYTPVTLDLSGDGEPEALRGASISAGLLDMLGTPPEVGRSFRPEEETPNSGVVIISQTVAKRRFGSAEAAIGKRMVIDALPRTVVGVMPPRYSLLYQGGDVWVPLDLGAQQQAKPRLRILATFGRLRPGATPAQARSDIASIQNQLRDEQPDAFPFTGIRVKPLREALFGPQRASMYVLLGALMLVLLIAGANVGNLNVADVIGRRTATMTRLAMGASRRSIVSLRMMEASVLAAASLVAGVLLAYGALKLFIAIDPTPFLALGNQWIDSRVIAVAVGAVAIVALCATLPAAIGESRVDIGTIAGAATKTAGGRSDRRLRHTLATIQVAITVVLLSGAALLGRDFVRLMAIHPGFQAPGVLVVQLHVSSREHPTVESRAQYVDGLVHAVRAVPGVDGASTIQTRFVLNETMATSFDIEGRPATPGVQQFGQIRHVMPDVFRVLGIRVVQGRGLDSTDRANGRPVAVVSSSFARAYWPGENAIGKRLRRNGAADYPWLDVVGVVDDIMDAGAGVPIGPTLYLPYLQQNTATARVTIVARTKADPSVLGRPIRKAIWSVNPTQAIDDINALTTLMSRSAAQPRFQMLVVTAFGVSALLLVLAGVYALTLFAVLGRMRELGVRAALGATPNQVVVLAMRGSMAPVAMGVMLGALLAVPVTRLMQRIINARLELSDTVLLIGVVLLLISAAALAALIPARRAGRVSPAVALR